VSISLRSRIRQACLLGCVSGAALLAPIVGQASAATYPSGGSSFTGGAEGWKATPTECKLLGIVEVLCTTEGTGYDGTAGAPAGSLADKAQIPVSALSLFKAAFVDESPAFTAVAGGSGTLSLSRRFLPGGLLSLTPTFTYTAYLVDKSTGTKQKAITETLGAEAPFATKTGPVSLTAGDTYVVQIEASTTASSVLGLLTETSSNFDNVVVSGPDPTKEEEKPKNGENGENGAPGEKGAEGQGGSNGGNGTAGSSGANGANGTSGTNGSNGTTGGSGEGAGAVSAARLESMMQSSLIGPATLHGTTLSVKAKCPAKAGATCTIALQGMLSRKQAATAGRKAKVKKAKTKNFALTVKPAARATVRTRQQLMFKETIKVGESKATVYKTLQLIRK
jgi:hypothetical protein